MGTELLPAHGGSGRIHRLSLVFRRCWTIAVLVLCFPSRPANERFRDALSRRIKFPMDLCKHALPPLCMYTASMEALSLDFGTCRQLAIDMACYALLGIGFLPCYKRVDHSLGYSEGWHVNA